MVQRSLASAFTGYEVPVIIELKPRHAALAVLLSVAVMAGCDSADQPADPSNSTLEQPSISDVPEGNMVPPVQPEEPGTSDAPSATVGG